MLTYKVAIQRDEEDGEDGGEKDEDRQPIQSFLVPAPARHILAAGPRREILQDYPNFPVLLEGSGSALVEDDQLVDVTRNDNHCGRQVGEDQAQHEPGNQKKKGKAS